MNNASNDNKLNSKNPFKPGLAARLRQEREAHGYTQIQLAEQIGINRMTQYLYERETNTPNLKYLSAIADLGLDVFYILFGSRGSAGPELRFSPPELLYEIYDVVDAIGTDAQGNLLPLESRREFFKVLCAAYSGRQAEKVDVTSIPGLIGKIPKAK
ncbi:MAG: helix-turn-helix transcriptional regulator [Chromatiales bacterium]|nr:helix-turn-helix transcriptional regulator [Chromatiales bacterium]